jgi:prepilin-type N-terminal cleavage/methylation domain-containing protein
MDWNPETSICRGLGLRPNRAPGLSVNCRQKPTGNGREAFTLLELMVVLVLLGILSAAILPAMRGTYEDAVLRSTARELVNVFELAYSRAVSLNQVQRVTLDEATGRYALESQGRSTDERGFAPVRDVPGGTGTLDSRIGISVRLGSELSSDEHGETETPAPMMELAPRSKETGFTFYPDGTADAGEIRLQDREGFRIALRVNPVTARVRVLEVARE